MNRHVLVIPGASLDSIGLECTACHAVLRIRLPSQVGDLTAAADAFDLRHEGCARAKARAEQTPAAAARGAS